MDYSIEISKKLDKIKTDHRFFDRQYADEIDELVETFARNRFNKFGATPMEFKLYPDTDFNASDGEYLIGYLPEGTFLIGDCKVVVEVISMDSPCTPDIYNTASFKIYRGDRNVTNEPESLPVMTKFSTLYEEIASACMAFRDSMEGVYHDWVVDFSAKTGIGLDGLRKVAV